MLGIILCGGKSTRMGSDKGLLKLDDTTWAQAAVNKMAFLNLPVYLSINPAQYATYAAVFDEAQLIKDDPSIDVHGPLAGVLNVHEKFPMQDLFVLACDLPLMEVSVMQQLLDAYHRDNTDDAFLFTNDGEPEPLCAIYAARGLAHIRAMHQQHQLAKHSMKFMLEQLDKYYEPLTNQQKLFFRNFNAHADINGL
jgi:molybdopterin-guanine dinucleotide biosynthesis protein A